MDTRSRRTTAPASRVGHPPGHPSFAQLLRGLYRIPSASEHLAAAAPHFLSRHRHQLVTDNPDRRPPDFVPTRQVDQLSTVYADGCLAHRSASQAP
ncbi:hypothetical protein [Streptomyces sp. AA0539]|uniref:hypothetical protein n=1 Tax=Streptomyces sp. AA0539 TaxID=1210045 RepID=UPI00031EF833|nr:hypothetical protein [Streptomyces sp. AA0539]